MTEENLQMMYKLISAVVLTLLIAASAVGAPTAESLGGKPTTMVTTQEAV